MAGLLSVSVVSTSSASSAADTLQFSLRAGSGVEHGPDFRFALESRPIFLVQLHKLGGDAKSFGPRCYVQNRIAADHFLRFGEGPIRDRDFAASKPHTGAVLAGQQTSSVHKNAVLLRLLDKLAHRLHQFGR